MQFRDGKARLGVADPCQQVIGAARNQVLQWVRGVERVLINRQIVSEGSVALVLSLTRPVLYQRGWGDIEAERRGRQVEALGAVASSGSVVVETIFVLLPAAGFSARAPAGDEGAEPPGGNGIRPGAFAPHLGEVGNVLIVGEGLGVAPGGGVAVGPALPRQPRGVLADGDGVVCQHVGPQVGVEGHRLDRAALLLELPIATGHHRAGGIIACGNIGTSSFCQPVYKILPYKTFRHKATIQKNVTISIQRLANGVQIIKICIDLIGTNGNISQNDLPLLTVGEYMDSFQICLGGQCIGYLL